MSQRCFGKNCQHTTGFDIPHSPECEFANQPVRGQDNSCGPNNIELVDPTQEDAATMGSAEYMKLLVLAMYKLDIEEIIISTADIEDFDSTSNVICIANMEDGIHLRLVSPEEAQAIAKDENGVMN